MKREVKTMIQLIYFLAEYDIFPENMCWSDSPENVKVGEVLVDSIEDCIAYCTLNPQCGAVSWIPATTVPTTNNRCELKVGCTNREYIGDTGFAGTISAIVKSRE